ncbi:DNA gyrase/topoisomerase IV subunit A [Marivirga harenae]|uniref:DNA gyrase/topoisomerase IV subunit A n=1 Tax=Marivirga harenae TaxID=2010992 RepID=UPI0026E0C43A|nr:DNA gyrase/topoisomerase IV subunit A [Marivirga harenae]WKV11541.1 DNA gyrase/topoisomerase IV subunit A [Marivirga harenae]|tara:strand:- start:24144 stop:26747 length:2604 start_codon:yes stop_codon:yes gene_type:complete
MEENNENIEPNNNQNGEDKDKLHNVIPVSGMYENWFLDYASYVILERAVPANEDGFKPVQRRIMHAMKEMDDGRFNKVANIIGQTMQYHPHGDASIGDAIVNMGQKDILIETQGNWGDIRTGDSSAAPRYIEARLSKFALDVVFNPQTTEWQLSYDGRKKEPVTLPVKFPLLLAQGVEGIAVGLSTKILPHNFCELINACIDVLKNKKVEFYPDFPTGGMADFSEYNQGLRGGKIRVRAKIEEGEKRTLLIKNIPFGTTTTGLIESIIKANDKGKIKVKKVVDNTAKDVEIEVQLAAGQSPDITIDALYAFTDCEVSISPNACVIIEDKPHFLPVNEILKKNVDDTLNLLERELEIRKGELMEKILFSSLEKIFIENRIYRNIEECETWEAVLETIDKGLEPFKPQFYRDITQEDIIRLTEIKIKRISKFDKFKADELMRKLEEELKEVEHHLQHLTEYAIAYYKGLLEKYGKGKERKTEIKSFDNIQAHTVAANNQKLYVNRAEGFIGYGMKKDEFVTDCSDLDDVIAFKRDGTYKVVRIDEKVFVGKDIIHVDIFRKNDERRVYNAAYLDGKTGRTMVKRFQVLSVTRDRDYDVSKGAKGSKVLYLEARPNGESEVINVKLSNSCRARVKVFDFDFAELEIKGRGAGGNILTKYPVKKIEFKLLGESSFGGLKIYYDQSVGKLNTDERGQMIGSFHGDDNILVINKDGSYELSNYELTNRFDGDKVLLIEKFDPNKVIASVYYDGASKNYYVKRFQIETRTLNKAFVFISEHKKSVLTLVTTDKDPQLEIEFRKGKGREKESAIYDFDMLIDVKGWKAIGNKLSQYDVTKVKLLESKKEEKPKEFKSGDSIEFDVDDDKEQLGLF